MNKCLTLRVSYMKMPGSRHAGTALETGHKKGGRKAAREGVLLQKVTAY